MLLAASRGRASAPCAASQRAAPRPLLPLPRRLPTAHCPTRRTALRVAAEAAAAPPAPASPAAPPPTEVDHLALVLDELRAKKKLVVVQTAPAVRVSIGEEMGLPAGTAVTGKMVAGLRRLGFDYVFGEAFVAAGCAGLTASPPALGPLPPLPTEHPHHAPTRPDTLVGADLTIMEEGTELLERLHSSLEGDHSAGPLPMFTSCCPVRACVCACVRAPLRARLRAPPRHALTHPPPNPPTHPPRPTHPSTHPPPNPPQGWIMFVESCAPELLPHVSSCKSPHMMVRARVCPAPRLLHPPTHSHAHPPTHPPAPQPGGRHDQAPPAREAGSRAARHQRGVTNALCEEAGVRLGGCVCVGGGGVWGVGGVGAGRWNQGGERVPQRQPRPLRACTPKARLPTERLPPPAPQGG